MRKLLIFALGVMWPFSAAAQEMPLRGQWNVLASNRADYTAVVLIDAEGRFTWDSPNDGGQRVQFFGAIVSHNAAEMHAIITDRIKALKIGCEVASNELLQCRATSDVGKEGSLFFLKRVGVGPVSLRGAR